MRETVKSYVKNEHVYRFTKIRGGGERSRWDCSCGARGPWVDRARLPELIAAWDAHCDEVHDASTEYFVRE